jgi:hypothetical protein
MDGRLQLLLGLASAVILRSESRVTHDHILLSQIPISLLITSWHGPRRIHRLLYCCVWIRCSGNMFVSRPLPSNGSTRYNMLCLRMLFNF